MNHPDNAQLNDFVDGLTDPGEAERIERHLAGCVPCRSEVASLRSLKAQAAGLATEPQPARDLWPDIEARIRTSSRPPIPDLGRRGPSRRSDARRSRPWFRPALAAAAALILLAVGTGIGLTIARGGLSGPGGVEMATNGVSESGDPTLRFAGVAQEVEEAYAPTIQELRQILEAGRDELAPETVEVLEESLRLIDQALAEAREALEADPGNAGAMRSLHNMYETKLHVLRTAAGLARGA